MEKIKLSYDVSEYEQKLLEEYNKNCDTYNSQPTINEVSKNILLRNQQILKEFEYLDTLNPEPLIEMAMFKKDKSGLSHTIWIDEAGKSRKKKDKLPRIKIQDNNNSDNLVSFLIDKTNPIILAGEFKKRQDISDISEFVKIAYNDLMDVWNQKITGYDFIEKYKKNI